MAHDYAKAFYTSTRWRQTRQAYIDYRRSIDGGVCEECGQRLGEIVHHKVMITPANINDASVTLSFNNLELVCWQCHNAFPGHAWGHEAKPEPRAIIDPETGDVIGVKNDDNGW